MPILVQPKSFAPATAKERLPVRCGRTQATEDRPLPLPQQLLRTDAIRALQSDDLRTTLFDELERAHAAYAQIAEGTVVSCDDALDLLDLGQRCRYETILVVGAPQRKGTSTDHFVNGDRASELERALRAADSQAASALFKRSTRRTRPSGKWRPHRGHRPRRCNRTAPRMTLPRSPRDSK